jgi:integrase
MTTYPLSELQWQAADFASPCRVMQLPAVASCKTATPDLPRTGAAPAGLVRRRTARIGPSAHRSGRRRNKAIAPALDAAAFTVAIVEAVEHPTPAGGLNWLVTGHVIDVNPAHAVLGPKYVVKKGTTPVLNAEEALALRDSIDISTLTGLRDRALIGVMVYTFARVNAVISMNVKDYFTQGRRGWVRLHEKGGKAHEVPCHHMLEKYLDEYLAAAEIAGDTEGPLFRTTGRKTGQAHAMWQQDAYRMIQRRAAHASRPESATTRSVRPESHPATSRKGLLEHAQTLANHSSPHDEAL